MFKNVKSVSNYLITFPSSTCLPVSGSLGNLKLAKPNYQYNMGWSIITL